jgi:hypothetical protein
MYYIEYIVKRPWHNIGILWLANKEYPVGLMLDKLDNNICVVGPFDDQR